MGWDAFHIANGSCLEVKAADRVGVLVSVAPSSITYQFNFNSPFVLFHSVPSPIFYPQLGDVIDFDSLAFPFEFSVIVHVEIGNILLCSTHDNVIDLDSLS